MADPLRSADKAPTFHDEERGPAGALAAMLVETRSVMPAAGATGMSLMLAIAAMCFLASLALGAALSVGGKAREWTNDLSGSLTVEIKPSREMEPEEQVDAVMAVLAQTPGIATATPLTFDDTAALLEPWLGGDVLAGDLPLPRLIDIAIDRASPPDLAALAIDIAAAAPGAALDTHRQWRSEIVNAARSAEWLSYGVLALVAATTIAIVVFATRAGLSANRDVVEVLHLIGARDGFIASEVQRHFLHLGFRGGLIGAGAGAAAFLALGLAGAAGNLYLVSASGIGPEYLPALIVIPFAAALVAVATARITVFQTLERML